LEAGVSCSFINHSVGGYKYGGDDNNLLITIWRVSYAGRKNAQNNILKKIIWALLYQFASLMLFFWTLIFFDVYIFGFAGTFFNYRELAVLKFLNKKIIYLFHGTDSRPPYLNGIYQDRSVEEIINSSSDLKNRLTKIEKYADHIICNPPQGQFHERKFINRLSIGSPISCPNDDLVKQSGKSKQGVTLIHFPSNPKAKGTTEIRKIVKSLKNDGYKIDYIELKNVSNQTVMDEISKCDIVVDQLYSDFILTGASMEASCLGKPSVMGGYYADYLGDDYKGFVMPVFCLPEDLRESLIELIGDKALREKRGREAHEYVSDFCSPIHVAKKYLRIISGDIPREWYYDPQNISYPFGCGMSKDNIKVTVSRIINDKGISALQISDKPKLENIFKKMVKYDP
jgi:hypothetical protein